MDRYRDGEIDIEIQTNVRGYDVFVIQSACQPINEMLMELIMMIDALRRASPARITAVIPYFGYARQDRRVRSARVPISAKVCADMIGRSGVDRVVTVDLHADQIQGFFNVPVENLYATPVLLEAHHRLPIPQSYCGIARCRWCSARARTRQGTGRPGSGNY